VSSSKGSLTDPLRESKRSNFFAVGISLWLLALMKDFDVAIVILSRHQEESKDHICTKHQPPPVHAYAKTTLPLSPMYNASHQQLDVYLSLESPLGIPFSLSFNVYRFLANSSPFSGGSPLPNVEVTTRRSASCSIFVMS
jgi:hypothetical protein